MKRYSMKKTYLKKIYRFNEESKAYIIDVSLDYYQELFNDWDGSPTRKRDLDPELVTYLEAASLEIPRKSNVEISFSLPLSEKNCDKEKKATDGINTNFLTALYFTKKALSYNLRKIILFVLLGVIFIMAAYIIQYKIDLTIGFDVLIEGLFIGGWVLLWEAFSLFFFSMHELRREKSMYLRFLNSEIVFDYRETK